MFYNFKHNLKTKHVSIIRIVTFLLLFLAISDRTLIFNMFKNLSNITNINNLSIDSLFNNLINIGKIVSFDYSLSISISYIMMGIAGIILMFLIIFSEPRIFVFNRNFKIKFDKVYQNKYIKSNRNIYLETNKFIC